MVDYAELYLRLNRQPHKLLEDLLSVVGEGLAPADLIIDAGCGPGLYIQALYRLISPEGRIIELDILRDMLKSATKKASELGRKRVIVAEENRLENLLDFVDPGTADLVLCASVFQFTDLRRAIKAVATVLRDNGLLVFSVPMGLSGLLDKDVEGFDRTFWHEMRSALVRHVRAVNGVSARRIMKNRPPREFKTFHDAVKKAGFNITHHYTGLQTIPARRLADHLVVPWRAQRLLPSVPQRTAERCIRRAVKETITELEVKRRRCFHRDIHYVAAKKRRARVGRR